MLRNQVGDSVRRRAGQPRRRRCRRVRTNAEPTWECAGILARGSMGGRAPFRQHEPRRGQRVLQRRPHRGDQRTFVVGPRAQGDLAHLGDALQGEHEVAAADRGGAGRCARARRERARREGSKVRITAQLIDAGADNHLWSRSYDRDLVNVLGVQDEIAREVGRALEVELGGAAGALAPRGTRDPEAYELYRRGRYLSAVPPSWTRSRFPPIPTMHCYATAPAITTALSNDFATRLSSTTPGHSPMLFWFCPTRRRGRTTPLCVQRRRQSSWAVRRHRHSRPVSRTCSRLLAGKRRHCSCCNVRRRFPRTGSTLRAHTSPWASRTARLLGWSVAIGDGHIAASWLTPRWIPYAPTRASRASRSG